jgi:predicted Ser/Thr protein kinase
MRALSPLHECALIGEGTFGKCLSGKYQNLPVAVKVFKGNQSVKSIHHEASIYFSRFLVIQTLLCY